MIVKTWMNVLVYIRGTRPRKQPSKPNESTTKSKDVRTFFSRKRNVTAHACTKKVIVIDEFVNLRAFKSKRIFSCYLANKSLLQL